MKTIRLIIVLALIFGSLALDMSSAKERSATSAYTTLYTELGFTEGYKSMQRPRRGGRAGPIETFSFFIRIAGAGPNGKSLDIGAGSVQTTDKFVQNGGAITFPTTASLKALFPDWMKKKCTNEACTFQEIKSFTNLKNENYYYQVALLKDNKSFQIILTYGAENCYELGCVSHSKIYEQTQIYINSFPVRTESFWRTIASMKNDLGTALEFLNALKLDAKKRTAYWKEKNEKIKIDLEKFLKKKEALRKEIEIINANIDRKKTSVLTNQSLKAKCEDELMNLYLQIKAEEARIAAAKVAAAKELALAKATKAEKVKLCFYYIEASFYYRVFAEKLVKTEADLVIATTGAALTATQTKIKTAFFPVLVNFATTVAK